MPTNLPLGNCRVGWLYIRVSVYSEGTVSSPQNYCCFLRIPYLRVASRPADSCISQSNRREICALTTHKPDTELLARNVHILSAGRIPRSTSCFFVQLYVGSCTCANCVQRCTPGKEVQHTDDPIAVLRIAASTPRTKPRSPSDL